MGPENRREYLRTDVLIPARLRVLNQEEATLFEQGDVNRVLEGDIRSSPIDEIIDQLPTGSKEETLYRCLRMIDKKVSFIIEQMTSTSHHPVKSLHDVVELSGSGLKFLSSDPFPEGILLKIELIMPGTFEFEVTLIAKVVRSEPLGPSEKAGVESFSVAVHFAQIDEKARDAIIETIFRTQRKIIRLEKTQKKGE